MKELWDAFSPDVMAELARPVRTYDPRDAEIIADVVPNWCIIEVHEPRQRDVEKALIDHRFGIYVPEVEKTFLSRGRKSERLSPMFPGYIFVFVWGLWQHYARIRFIPGVLQVMGAVDDRIVDEVRTFENGKRPLFRKKRRHRGGRAHDEEPVRTYTWSAFPDRLLMLDSKGRNEALRQALGL
jgi:transcription termination factor NusG